MAETIKTNRRHVVAVIGGATAGSEVARVFAGRGALVIVVEQNARPYGKIEDGLPRWHVKQRLDEYEEINRRLDNPNILYLPLTRMGRDLNFDELRESWGLNAIVLANGAWRDRPFPVDGADLYVDKGLVYQNPLIYWFNHYLEAEYNGPRYRLEPGTIVIGGGLASIDVVKVLQIEMALAGLRQRGIKEEMLRLEREGIEPVLKSHQLTWADLGIESCKLFYRRRVIDMPLSDIPEGTPAKRAESLRMARSKILDKAQRKFLFEFHDQNVPTALMIKDGRMTGLQMTQTEVVEGKARKLAGSEYDVAGPMTISSIGSIPEAIPGIPQAGEVYRYLDQNVGLVLEGRTAVYASGNVLTGKGNIKDSLVSGTHIGIHVAEQYLGLAEDGARFELSEVARREAAAEAKAIAADIEHRAGLGTEAIGRIEKLVRERQEAVGYEGSYRAWIKKMTPPDLH
jgi:ferredoxin--NADP+ reductase